MYIRNPIARYVHLNLFPVILKNFAKAYFLIMSPEVGVRHDIH